MPSGKGKQRVEQPTLEIVVAGRPVAIRVRQIVLDVAAGPDAGAQAVLGKRELSVGSHPSNDLVLRDPAVSRFHFRIVADDSGYRVIDTTSTNGTFVNGVRVQQGYLFDGAQIRLGSSTVVMRFGQQDTEIELSGEESFGSAVGRSVAMREVFATARRAAATNATILLLGETGTGKDVLARAIHDHSSRASGAFVVFDCAATPSNLVESALFGHARGAFTGADDYHAGVFERASGGTLFLDEIGELPLELQPKLLRALDGGAVTPVGASGEVAVSVRVIAATNRDLRAMVAIDAFRPDLYYRLAVVPLELPPLRDRPEDIPLLASHFLRDILAREGHPIGSWDPHQIDQALAGLQQQPWPGNVRELRNVIERAVALASVAELAGDGPPQLGTLRSSVLQSRSAQLPMQAAREQFDRHYVREVLDAAEGDVRRAAGIAKIHRKSFERLMRKHGIQRR